METKTITAPLKAIRAKCIDCVCGQVNEVKECISTDCSLHAFRMGTNPYRAKREYTPEQLEQLRTTMLKNRADVKI